MFRRKTATFIATTPASKTATTPIQTTPLVTRRGRFAARGAGLGLGLGCSASAAQVAIQTLTPTRNRADEERGLTAVSGAPGRMALRERERNCGSLPHTQTGKSGGHSQPRSRSRMNRFVI